MKIGWRSDGHRTDVQTSAWKRTAQPGDGQSRRRAKLDPLLIAAKTDYTEPGPARLHSLRHAQRLQRGADSRNDENRSLVPASRWRDGGVGDGAEQTHARCHHPRMQFRQAKRDGLSDRPNGAAWGTEPLEVREARKELGVHAVFNRVDTCAAEFESFTPYLTRATNPKTRPRPPSARR